MEQNDEALNRMARLIELGLSQRLSRRELIWRGLGLGLSLSTIGAALSACGMEPPPASEGNLSNWRPPATAGAVSPTPPLAIDPRPTPVTISGGFTQATAAPTLAPSPTRFAVIGDYGMEGEPAAAVAALVASWNPEFILTTGDNNYPDGAAETIDRNVGQYYQSYIAPYQGGFGPGASENRFFPVLGNHDWVVGFPEPYLSYFRLPGNGRYYSFEQGPLRFFALDSMPGEPDGISADSVQAQWLQAALAESTARWNVVFFHHSPYSSGHHGSSDWMRWPFAEWGAHVVLGGHDHHYERVSLNGITYLINGLGGGARYAPGFTPADGSQIFFNADHGALLVEADLQQFSFKFITRAGTLIDELTMQ